MRWLKAFLVCAVLAFPVHGLCAPFATCDCTPAVDLVLDFQTQTNAGAWVTGVPAVLTCGSGADKVVCTGDQRTICIDMATIPAGPFTLKARARNAWGLSNDSLPLSGTKATPTSPSLKVVQ
jgi:hypothetical protein